MRREIFIIPPRYQWNFKCRIIPYNLKRNNMKEGAEERRGNM